MGDQVLIRVGTIFNSGSDFGLCVTRAAENSACEEAIALPVDGQCGEFDLTSATTSPDVPPLNCGFNPRGADLWFSTVVPASGNLRIETFEVEGGVRGVDLEVYVGSCDDLVPLACSETKERFTVFDPYALVELEGQTPDANIIIRVVSDRSSDSGPFEICVTDMPPQRACIIDLMLLGDQSACDPLTNTFSQDVEIHYRADESVDRIRTSRGSFDLTGSPQVVTLENLPSNGNILSYFADLRGPSFNSCASNSFYRAEDLLVAPDNCFSGSVANDDCSGAIPITVGQSCEQNTFDNIGATTSTGGGVIDFCRFAGDNPQDVWFTVEVPTSNDFVIALNFLGAEPIFDIYAGNCLELNRIASCGDRGNSLRITDRTPGEILYVRVATSEGETQGQFNICAFELEPFENDICNTATELSFGSSCAGGIYHTQLSTSETGDRFDCDNTNTTDDQWFKFTIPSGGAMSLFTEEVENSFSDIILELYEGDCSSLNLVSCDFNFDHPNADLSNFQPGTTLFARLASRFDRYTSFRICAIADCPDETFVTRVIQDPQLYEVGETIRSTSTIENPGEVIFDAGFQSVLNPGFEVLSGGKLDVFTDGCED